MTKTSVSMWQPSVPIAHLVRTTGDRSAKRLRLLAEASLQHCLLAVAAAAEDGQQQQEQEQEPQLYHRRQAGRGKPAAAHTNMWDQPVKPQIDAEADLLQQAAADAVRVAEEKCQVRAAPPKKHSYPVLSVI